MLGQYVRAAKRVVQVKQARQGVAVHVRVGAGTEDTDSSASQGSVPSNDNAGSCAVWALTTGRDAAGYARVGCSEGVQTQVPRSSIQSVSVRPYNSSTW